MKSLFLLPVLAGAVFAADSPTFLEKGGIVAIEAESTASRLGKWLKKHDVADFSGDCHLEFTGNKTESGPPNSPLKYSFQIQKGGTYRLTLRGRKRLETKREDISNDCFVAVSGDYEEAGGAPLKILRSDTKMFGGAPDKWAWCELLDVSQKKHPALYQFKEGEAYELTISGRSKNFNLDRILFVHEDHDLRKTQRENPKESARSGGGLAGSRLRVPVVRKLTNQAGLVIKAQLVSKAGDSLTIRKDGKRFDVPISSLSADDQAFIKDWEP